MTTETTGYGDQNIKRPRVARTTGGLSQRRNNPMTDVKPIDGTTA